ncbi:MAG TPA: transglycosylase SLT domain-containing protein [Candidatus Nanopelagicales bacterium]|nr:transglycosylase SLT domain-containing protein [Candidatus Nanopelagicales bacterium]
MRRLVVSALLGLSALGAGAGGCAEHRIAGPPPAQSTAQAAAAAPASAPVSTQAAEAAEAQAQEAQAQEAAAAELGWADAVRLERWADAAAKMDALPEAERGRPEMRYARARVALALGDAEKAAGLLHRLEGELPLLAADIARYRAEAALTAGPLAEAVAYYSRSRDPRDLARAAEALARGGDVKQGLAMAGRAVAAAQRSKRKQDEAAARFVRARIVRQAMATTATAAAAAAKVPAAAAAKVPAAVVADLRWIARNAPATAEGREAAAALAESGAVLTPAERLEAAEALVEGGGAAEAAAELTRLGSTGVLPRPELLHRRATALYRARDYDAAATAFLEAAALPTARKPEQLYYAARSLARQDRNSEAIERLLEVSTKYPRTSWAEGASYLAAQLLMLSGRYEDAAKHYARFVDRFPRSDRREEAEYDRALSLISAGDPAGARKQLGRLSAKARRIDDAARLRQLEGLAALRAGDRAAAVSIWAEVMKDYPLSWGALTARARLIAEGQSPPPLLGPPSSAETTPPLAITLPPAAALLASVGLDADAERWIAENERAVAAPYGPRAGEALCAMYGSLSRAKRRYRVGVNAVAYEALKRAPSEADRWAWECLYPQPYLSPVRALEEEHGLPRGLVHALMRQESAFDPVVVSPASAVGLMQLMPSTAEKAAREMEMGLELEALTSPEVNLRLGGYYIGKLVRMFDGSLPLATAAYNAGPKAVSRWVAGAERDTDLWVARIPYGETRHYVGRVLANLARYQWLTGGDAAVTAIPLEIPAGVRAPDDAY